MSRVKIDWRMGSKAVYFQFCEEHPEIKLSYVQYQAIVYGFNEAFRDHLFETGMKGKLPWGFGDFAVSKRKPRQKKRLPNGDEVISLPVDWKKTKEAGKKIYHLNRHTEGFKFKLKWFINSTRFKFSEIWSFKPMRNTSRLIRHYIDMGHQHKYYEWDLINTNHFYTR